MISINTNLASLIIQQNLKNSSLGLNQAIERMTTGSKLNHAKNNAANFSINTGLKTKLGGYLIAQDNASMGLDMATTAMDSLNLLSDHLSRLRALAEQAANGTYGANSLQAIHSEAIARIQECKRTIRGTEYNQINLFGEQNFADEQEAELDIDTEVAKITRTVAMKMPKESVAVSNSTHDNILPEVERVSSVSNFVRGKTYTLEDSTDLVALQNLVASGKSTSNVTFMMSGDINMRDIEFEGIKKFEGIFDGNGYAIKNLKIDREDTDEIGLFCKASGTIKNLGLVDCDIKGKNSVGGLVGAGLSTKVTIDNSYVTGSVKGENFTGGFVGRSQYSSLTIEDSYTNCDVTGTMYTGGFVGQSTGYITNCYALKSVNGTEQVGGFIGTGNGYIKNSYAKTSVTGNSEVGGFLGKGVGNIENSYVISDINGGSNVGGFVGYGGTSCTNCYFDGNVEGVNGNVGGFVGFGYNDAAFLENCYSTGNIKGQNSVGGLIGSSAFTIKIENCYTDCLVSGNESVGGIAGSSPIRAKNCYVLNSVTGTGEKVGGFVGFGQVNLEDCIVNTSVKGSTHVGGFVGQGGGSIQKCYFKGDIIGVNSVGGIWGFGAPKIFDSYFDGNIEAEGNVGGLIGWDYDSATRQSEIQNCYSTGNITGKISVGGLIGTSTFGNNIENCYTNCIIGGNVSVGGLVGSSAGRANITNCCVFESVTGKEEIGGLLGKGTGNIQNSCVLTSVTGSDDCVGGLVGNGDSTIVNSYFDGTLKGANYTGGLVGKGNTVSIQKSYASGTVEGKSSVGGLVGDTTNISIENSYSNSSVTGTNANYDGDLVGYVRSNIDLKDVAYNNGSAFNTIGRVNGVLTEDNVSGLSSAEMNTSDVMEELGFTKENGWFYAEGRTPMLEVLRDSYNLEILNLTDFQVGIHSGASSKIRLGFEFSIDLKLDFSTSDKARESLGKIDEYLSVINQKQTEIGAGINRLESALEEISTQILNLSSTRSTIRDADIAKESSAYIKSQILQQAASTLLATANQTQSIALGLLQNATIRH